MDLPGWLTPLPDSAQQRALDTWAIDERGISSETLMERAGTGLARLCAELVPDGVIAVVCGKGNNGGDGHVAARVLRELGREVRVIDVGAKDASWSASDFEDAAAIIDALLGTGFSGAPRAPVSDAIEAINAAREGSPRPLVIACDVPSGVDASTGEVSGQAVKADSTVTFHAAKPGLWISPGKRHSGDVRVVGIGIPEDGQPVTPNVGLIRPEVLNEIPSREAGSNKFSVGSVLVVAGSRGLTGAPVLASTAAARAGAGYVTVMAPASAVPAIAAKLLEVMTMELPDDPESGPKRGSSRIVVERAQRAQALVLGPGLGRLPAAAKLARDVATYANLPLVLDADGLNAHSEEGALEHLADRQSPTVLTPHAGELGRLLQLKSSDIDARRLAHARAAADAANAIVVLKGDDTIVAEPGGRVAISPGGAPALATAGTGDVLSGVIGAYLAKGVDPFTAVCAAVHAHVRAGVLAAAQIGADGVIASDVISALPRVRSAPGSQESDEQQAN
jgi:ADP-dependent NAD(P)H-hydrate dehydratase / NAD(P)H-hydrate epimerase